MPGTALRSAGIGARTGCPGLLAVQLDDHLLLHRHVDELAGRLRHDRDLELACLKDQPLGDVAAGGERRGLHDTTHRAGPLPDRHDIAGLDPVRRDVDLAAVDLEMAVRDELAGLVPAHGEPAPVHHVVQSQLEELEQARAGDPLGMGGFLVVAAELLLKDAVDAASLLLLAELDQVLALLDATPAMLAGRVGAALDGALGPHAAGPLQEELHAFPPAEPADRPGVACHYTLR